MTDRYGLGDPSTAVTSVEELDDDDSSDEGPSIKSPSTEPPSGTSPDAANLGFLGDASSTDPHQSLPVAGPSKRPRGRPRKQPVLSPESQINIAKGRSKTGCITCRRRKKKCDETKPQCLNCVKNAVVCEGYPERVVWRSGKQRAEEARAARVHTRPQELPFLVDGIETEMDRFLLDHFVRKACTVLTMLNEDANPFKVLLLPMAIRHRGLMHSLLCFSGSHLASSDRQQVAERQVYHYQRALEELRTDTKLDDFAQGRSQDPIDDPTIATALVLCLDTICSGATDGQYRPHLEAARFLIQTQTTQDRAFGEFLIEFFTFHDTASALTAIDRRPVTWNDDFPLPRFIIQRDKEDRAFVGVFDGLFEMISRVTQLRDTVRQRRTLELEPAVDYQALCDAVSLDCSIRSWVCTQREGSPRYIAAQLYRQCTWIYLWRTVHPSRRTDKIVAAVEEGLAYVRQLPPDASSQSILLMPVFMLSTAAFLRDQRPELRKAFGTLKRYSNLRNIEAAREVVERIWSIMDAGEEMAEDGSWDWESIIKDMGYDFLVT